MSELTEAQCQFGVSGLAGLSLTMSISSQVVNVMVDKPGIEVAARMLSAYRKGMAMLSKVAELEEKGHLGGVLSGELMVINPNLAEVVVLVEIAGSERIFEMAGLLGSVDDERVVDPDAATRLAELCREVGQLSLSRAHQLDRLRDRAADW